MNKILNNGCSFSAGNRNSWETYCDFLPGEIYNIAKGASGIEAERVKNFLYKNTSHRERHSASWREQWPFELTHFIYQIPSPARQCIYTDLSEEEFYTADIQFYAKRKYTKSEEYFDENGRKFLWQELRLHYNTKIFNDREKYLKKALLEIHNNTKMLRKKWPDIKIIFLRYEENGMPLIYEFCKDWFKRDLADYCNNNNITYIYEDNFNTIWFRKNKLTADKRHLNTAGAKYIADKIIQHL